MSRVRAEWLALGLGIFLAFFAGRASAAPLILSRAPITDLFPHADLLEDPGGQLSIADVSAGGAGARFAAAGTRDVNVGVTSSAWWLRVDFAAPDHDLHAYLRGFHTTGDLRFFLDTGSGPQLIGHLGRELPFPARAIPHRQLYAPLSLPAGRPTRLFVRLRGKDTLQLRLDLLSGEAVAADVGTDRLIAGLYLGLIGALALYNFFLFLGLRDRTYAYYVVFQLFTGLLQASFDQITFQYLWPGSPSWAWWSESVFVGLALFGAAGFERCFLTSPRAPAPGRKLLLVVQWSSLALVVGAPLTEHAFFSLWAIAQVFFGCVTMFVCALWALQRGIPSARYLFAGWSAFLATTILACLTSAGLIPLVNFAEHATRVGSSAEAILLSLGLAHRIQVLRRDNERIRSDILGQRLAALGNLMSGVVHELGNPLTFIKGGADEIGRRARSLLASGALVEADAQTAPAVVAINEGVALVQSGATRIERIVANLRVDFAGQAVLLEETNVARVIDDTLTLVRPKLEEKGVTLKLELASMPAIRARPGELGQVVMNLVLNALEAVPQGGSLCIEGRRDGSDVVVTFRDSGPGVPASIRDAIFDPFFTSRPHGTGLGLFVSQQIAARHGGALRALEVSVGAAFELKLPVGAARRA
jgi:signal transduction histidine kinase